MIINARTARVSRRGVPIAAVAAAIALVAGCGGSNGPPVPVESDSSGSVGAGEEVTIEFSQWWEPEVEPGALRALMDRFEEENPGIVVKLLSAPYAATYDQMVASAATGTMADVVGLDPYWGKDFVDQGALADLTPLMKEAGFDESQLTQKYEMGGIQYMIKVSNGVLLLFTNDDLLAQAGIDAPPTTRSEFMAAAQAISALSSDVSGWSLPLSSSDPAVVGEEIMSQVWASGGRMLDADGKPDLTNADVRSAVQFVKDLWDANVVAPGSLNQTQQDKVEAFTNGRIGMVFEMMGRFSIIRERNPELQYHVSPIPIPDGYTGEQGATSAGWGIGVAESSEHKEEAWKLIQFIMSPDVNGEIATLSTVLPGNTAAQPDFAGSENYESAYEILAARTPVLEFDQVSNAQELQRMFLEELQLYIMDEQSLDEMLNNAQEKWLTLL